MNVTTTRTRTTTRTGTAVRRCARGLKAALAALGLSAATLALAASVAGAAGNRATLPAVANPALLGALNAAETMALRRNGFVVTAPSPLRFDNGGSQPHYAPPSQSRADYHEVYWQFNDLYQENYFNGIPTFMTSDALLHTWHVVYDQTLIVLERHALAPRLARLSDGLAAASAMQYNAATAPSLTAAARLNLGYLTVAGRLLGAPVVAAAIPASITARVNWELALIAAHQGFATSPLLGYAVDYSQFVPRGHYAGDPVLSRYFQAMTWYNLLAFHLNGADGVPRTRQAILLVRALVGNTTLDRLWAQVFDPITTWVGPSDDLTVRDYQAAMARVYGANAPLSALADDVKLARFRALANRLAGPRIVGVLATSGAGAAAMGKGFRLFGQRFVPDAAAMQALIWDKVGTPAHRRVWPSGLDIAATFGSRPANALVTGPTPYNQTDYAHYARQLANVQQTYRTLPGNLYGGWLNTLRAVWGPMPPAAPAFMKTLAWGDKSLATGLASWAELRHDTILYVKPPEGLGAGGPVIPAPSYVEPLPLAYTRLLALVGQLKATLIAEGILDTLPRPVEQYPIYAPPGYHGEHGYRGALDDFATQLALAERVSERELLGQTVSDADLDGVRAMFGELSLVDNFLRDNAAGRPLLLVDKQVSVIADVFTEPVSGQALEEGVGDVLPVYAVVRINGRRWLARGGVYSYYEFRQPVANRLTDDAWRHLARRPALPAWTAGYMAY